MILRFISLIIAVSLTGCASMSQGGIFYRSTQEKNLARAVKLLEKREDAPAAELLSTICAGPGVPGVTDEALFRLSLLRLGTGHDRNGVIRARLDLERLKRDYPTSSWAIPAAAVSSILTDFQGSAEDHRQVRKLKEVNVTLTKENKDLRQTIERLKNLEVELGGGGKR